MRLAGVDGCRGGWIAAVGDAAGGGAEFIRLDAFGELFAPRLKVGLVAVDMPIGLPERSGPRGRAPERELRAVLGPRQSSVFSIPSRSAVYAGVDENIPAADRYRHCCAVARATSAEGKAVAKQGYAIFPKIVEIDRWLRADAAGAARVFECHPEGSFWAMNEKSPAPLPKKVKGRPCPDGLGLRQSLLAAQGFDRAAMSAEAARALGVGWDDLIDACAALWTARRIAVGAAVSFPKKPEKDAYGLPIAIRA